MGQFFTARALKDHLDKLGESLGVGKNLVVVATSAQKFFIKSALLESNKGSWGVEVVTVSEYLRRNGYILNFELAVILASRLKQKNLQQAQTAISDFASWVGSGADAQDIPLPPLFKEPVLSLYAELKDRKTSWSRQFLPSRVFLVGFGLVESDKIIKQNPKTQFSVFAIEPNALIGVQMAARNSLEASLGEAQMLDLGEDEYLKIETSSENILYSIKDTLAKNPQIKRIVYTSDNISALMGDIFKPTKPQGDWWYHQRLELYKKAGANPSFENVLAFLRCKGVQDPELAKALLEKEREFEKYWQREGVLSLDLLSEHWQGLPESATVEEYMRLSQEIWSEDDQLTSQVRYLLPLEELLPQKKLSRDIWLSLMSVASRQTQSYGGLWAVSVNEALGLLDDQTLLLVGGLDVSSTPTLMDEDKLDEYNSAQIESVDPNDNSSDLLKGIWIERDATTPGVSEYELAPMIAYCAMPYPMQPINYIGADDVNKYETLSVMQSTRRSLETPWGEYDYALDQLNPTCKQWESILMSPPVAWYELHKLRPSWNLDNRSALWVGNWVHDAMAEYPEVAIKDFFESLNRDGSLLWKISFNRAVVMADYFANLLDGSEGLSTIQKEYNVSGRINIDDTSFALSGRVDRLLESDNGELLVVDFKTSSSAKKISKKIEEGDGLQLWLYAALLSREAPVGVCRLGNGLEVKNQRSYEDTLFLAQQKMLQVARKKSLGLCKGLFGQWGLQRRLPIASLPIDDSIVSAREEASQ